MAVITLTSRRIRNTTLKGQTSVSFPELRLLVAGQWRAGAGRETRPVIDPATEQSLAELPMANDGDVDDALDGAAATFAA